MANPLAQPQTGYNGGKREMHCFTGALCYCYYVSTVGAERRRSEEIVSTFTKRQYSILEKTFLKNPPSLASALLAGRKANDATPRL